MKDWIMGVKYRSISMENINYRIIGKEMKKIGHKPKVIGFQFVYVLCVIVILFS